MVVYTKEGAVRLIEKVRDAGWQLLQEAVQETQPHCTAEMV